jgi:hypothetical protein
MFLPELAVRGTDEYVALSRGSAGSSESPVPADAHPAASELPRIAAIATAWPNKVLRTEFNATDSC